MFESLMNTVKGIGSVKAEERGEAYPKMMDINDLWDTDLETAAGVIAVYAGTWVKVAQYQVPAQTKVALGIGVLGSLSEEKGYAYLLTKDDSAEEPGMYRFYAEDIHGNKTKLAEFRSEQLKAGGADFDRTKAQLISESDVLIREDSYLTIEFKSDADDDIVKANSVWLVPATLYKV
jgi:hypothetical protein